MQGNTPSNPTAEWLRKVDYVRLLAYLGESNLPPGGLNSVRRLINNTHLRPGMRILHAGSNAGFLSREIARRTGAEVVGIDISEEMVESATRLALREGMDMGKMEFPSGHFDVVISGGALAFVPDQRPAVTEWVRVLRPSGLLGDVEFYYRDSPPPELRKRISEAIGTPVREYRRHYWEELFQREDLQEYYLRDEEVPTRSPVNIAAYAKEMTRLKAIGWRPNAARTLEQRLQQLMMLFNENMKYMNYQIRVMRRKSAAEDPLLFT
jgi:SAM-dependent methyltransferase